MSEDNTTIVYPKFSLTSPYWNLEKISITDKDLEMFEPEVCINIKNRNLYYHEHTSVVFYIEEGVPSAIGVKPFNRGIRPISVLIPTNENYLFLLKLQYAGINIEITPAFAIKWALKGNKVFMYSFRYLLSYRWYLEAVRHTGNIDVLTFLHSNGCPKHENNTYIGDYLLLQLREDYKPEHVKEMVKFFWKLDKTNSFSDDNFKKITEEGGIDAYILYLTSLADAKSRYETLIQKMKECYTKYSHFIFEGIDNYLNDKSVFSMFIAGFESFIMEFRDYDRINPIDKMLELADYISKVTNSFSGIHDIIYDIDNVYDLYHYPDTLINGIVIKYKVIQGIITCIHEFYSIDTHKTCESSIITYDWCIKAYIPKYKPVLEDSFFSALLAIFSCEYETDDDSKKIVINFILYQIFTYLFDSNVIKCSSSFLKNILLERHKFNQVIIMSDIVYLFVNNGYKLSPDDLYEIMCEHFIYEDVIEDGIIQSDSSLLWYILGLKDNYKEWSSHDFNKLLLRYIVRIKDNYNTNKKDSSRIIIKGILSIMKDNGLSIRSDLYITASGLNCLPFFLHCEQLLDTIDKSAKNNLFIISVDQHSFDVAYYLKKRYSSDIQITSVCKENILTHLYKINESDREGWLTFLN